MRFYFEERFDYVIEADTEAEARTAQEAIGITPLDSVPGSENVQVEFIGSELLDGPVPA